ncbi:hypothetical protein IB273_06325 [Pseudomonas sp. PDM19]|nr:hypothetical protein [Pseudomonas sp. PDM19]
MPTFQICDAEWDALFDEPHQLLKVYCAIRMFMDYGTGIAGEERRLSEQMLIEVLSIPASPGRPAHKATRKEARYTVDALVRRGLLEPMPSIGPFVFHLPKASRDQSVSGRWGQRLAVGGAIPGALGGAGEFQPEPAQIKAFDGLDGAGGAGGRDRGCPEVGPEVGPTSGLPTTELPTPLPRASHDPPKRFPMHDAWVPSPNGWPATLMRNGMHGYRLKDDDLLEFRSYWINREDKHQSQGQWEHQLAMTVKNNQVRASGRSSHGNPSGSQEPSEGEAGIPAASRRLSRRQGPLSAVDRVKAGIAARQAQEQAAGRVLGEDDRDVRPPVDIQLRS